MGGRLNAPNTRVTGSVTGSAPNVTSKGGGNVAFAAADSARVLRGNSRRCCSPRPMPRGSLSNAHDRAAFITPKVVARRRRRTDSVTLQFLQRDRMTVPHRRSSSKIFVPCPDIIFSLEGRWKKAVRSPRSRGIYDTQELYYS